MDSKTCGTLCWKYPNQPFSVRFRFAQMAFIHLPLLRRVLLRTASLSLSMLFLRGHFFPLSLVAKEVESSSLTGIYDPCFSRVQFQSVFFYPLADLFQRLLRFLLAHAYPVVSA